MFHSMETKNKEDLCSLMSLRQHLLTLLDRTKLMGEQQTPRMQTQGENAALIGSDFW